MIAASREKRKKMRIASEQELSHFKIMRESTATAAATVLRSLSLRASI